MAFRDGYGKKTKYNTTIRSKILKRIQDRATEDGIPANRIIEDALILYDGMRWKGIPAQVVSDLEKGHSLLMVCNKVAKDLERFFALFEDGSNDADNNYS